MCIFISGLKAHCQLNHPDLLGCAAPHYDVWPLVSCGNVGRKDIGLELWEVCQELVFFWQALGHELGNDLQDSIVPLVVPTHVECFRAVVEDMKQCLPLSTELTGTRKAFPPSPHGQISIVGQSVLTALRENQELRG